MTSTNSPVSFTLVNLRFQSASASQIITTTEDYLDQDLHTRKGLMIGYINPHVYNLAQDHSVVQDFLNHCDFVCIDGLGVKLALLAKGYGKKNTPINRVVALQLFDQLAARTASTKPSVLIGVEKKDVNQAMININQLSNRFNILDCIDGFQTMEKYRAFLTQHQTIDWVLIGAGTPKSEQIARIAKEKCPHAIVFHMGAGSIKVYAGTKPRAASWISNLGFEWLHRIWFEPHTRERYTLGGWRFIRDCFFNHSANKDRL